MLEQTLQVAVAPVKLISVSASSSSTDGLDSMFDTPPQHRKAIVLNLDLPSWLDDLAQISSVLSSYTSRILHIYLDPTLPPPSLPHLRPVSTPTLVP